jgi:hypothetical protein
MSNEKLQAIFDAALRDEEQAAAVKSAQPVPIVIKEVGSPSHAAGFDRQEADELGQLLDEQVARIKRKRSLDFVITMCVLGGLVLGGIGWFVSDGKRVEALHAAIGEVRSVSDIQGIVANFQKSLDRVAVRSDQISDAAAALGVDPNDTNLKDVHMEAEMKQLMGDEGGRTVGERNRMLNKKFGDQAAEAENVPK